MKLWKKQRGFIGEIVGGLIGAHSARGINKKQIGLARDQMAFQERMSGTAYQRAAKDLEEAGLNRVLALGKPATTPPGAQPPKLDVPGAHTAAALSRSTMNAAALATIKETIAKTGLIKAQTRAISPAAEGGEAISEIIVNAKPYAKRLFNEFADRKVSLSPSPEGQLARPSSAKMTQTLKARERSLGSITLPKKENKTTIGFALQNTDRWITDYMQKHNGKTPSKEQIQRIFNTYIEQVH